VPVSTSQWYVTQSSTVRPAEARNRLSEMITSQVQKETLVLANGIEARQGEGNLGGSVKGY